MRGAGPGDDFLEYANVSPMIGAVISHRMASVAELETVLSTEDVYDLIEIIAVDRYNARPRK